MTTEAQTVSIHVALTIRRRGGRKQIVSPAGTAPWAPSCPHVDSTMVKALARAFRWRRMLETGAVGTVREAVGTVSPSYSQA